MRSRFLILLAAVVALGAAPAGADAATCQGAAKLPTLVSAVPSEIAVQKVGSKYTVVFRSGMTNVGSGALEIVGQRKSIKHKTIYPRQIIDCKRGPSLARRNIGTMKFVRRPTHQHWHLRDLERYRLVALADLSSRRAKKRGFCLGDSWDPGVVVAGKPKVGRFDGDLRTACAQGRSDALKVREGISPGWGDYYSPLIEGQYVDLSDLPDGQYRLLNELDPLRRLTFGSRAQSVAGQDFNLTTPSDGSAPIVELTGTCTSVDACASSEPFAAPEPSGSARLARPQPRLGGWFN